MFYVRDLSHWIGQGKTVLNWNDSVHTTHCTCTIRSVEKLYCKHNRLQANSPQLPNSNVESVRGNPIKSCNKQSLIWAKQSTNWWNWHPLSLNTTTLHSSTKSTWLFLHQAHYQAQATIFITFVFGLKYFRFGALSALHFSLILCCDHSVKRSQLAFQISKWCHLEEPTRVLGASQAVKSGEVDWEMTAQASHQ